MPTFNVTITRSAIEVVELAIEADSQDAAEEKLGRALDTTRSVTLEDLSVLQGAKVVASRFQADIESEWEIV
jgi:hypothetical protein